MEGSLLSTQLQAGSLEQRAWCDHLRHGQDAWGTPEVDTKGKNILKTNVSEVTVRAHCFARDQSSVSRSHVGWITAACTSSSRASGALFWLPWAPACVHRPMHIDMLSFQMGQLTSVHAGYDLSIVPHWTVTSHVPRVGDTVRTAAVRPRKSGRHVRGSALHRIDRWL